MRTKSKLRTNRKFPATQMGKMKIKSMSSHTHGAHGKAPSTYHAPHRAKGKITRKRGY